MLTANDIRVGGLYRAKRPVKVWDEVHNDRVVVWMNESRTRVQYDSKTVADGRHYPTVDMERFLKWAANEVAETEKQV